MIKKLKIRQTEQQKVFFTSDTHWHHDQDFVWASRGYLSAQEFTDDSIAIVNEIVRPNDILFHLGDITLNCSEQAFEETLARVKCQNIYMVWGNHNNPANKIYQREVKFWLHEPVESVGTDYFPEVEVYPFTYKNLTFLGNYAEIQVDGYFFVLCHYPIFVFNYMGKGAMHLCGHSHYNLALSRSEDLTSKILDVGWDGHARPLSLNEVIEIMDKKSSQRVDQHVDGI